jgi:hypothetical protein
MSYHLSEDGQYDKARIFDREDVLDSIQFEELEIALMSIFMEKQW